MDHIHINGSHPFVKYTFRFILTQLYSSFLSYRLFESNEQPLLSCEGDAQEKEHSTTEDITTCTQMGYWASRKRNSKRLSFRKFLRRFIDDVLGLSNDENENEQKQLPLRFSTSVLSSFSSNEMWSLRRTGVHNIIKKPQSTRRQRKDARVINTRVRKWCVICSRATKDLTTGKIQKKGFKTNFCCERCMVHLCSPYGKSKRLCWDVFHSTKNYVQGKTYH